MIYKFKSLFTNDSTLEKSDIDYTTVKGKIYHILVDEYFETNDENNPNVNVLLREYQVYDGNRNNVYSAMDTSAYQKRLKLLQGQKNIYKKVILNGYD